LDSPDPGSGRINSEFRNINSGKIKKHCVAGSRPESASKPCYFSHLFGFTCIPVNRSVRYEFQINNKFPKLTRLNSRILKKIIICYCRNAGSRPEFIYNIAL